MDLVIRPLLGTDSWAAIFLAFLPDLFVSFCCRAFLALRLAGFSVAERRGGVEYRALVGIREGGSPSVVAGWTPLLDISIGAVVGEIQGLLNRLVWHACKRFRQKLRRL
jgi:hypothetical protein